MFQNRIIDIAIGGGGATGVELAAELSRMVEFAASYGEVDIRRRLRVTLLEDASHILGAFPDAVSTSAAEQLRALGADVRTGVRVVATDAHGFLLDGGKRISAALKVWAGGRARVHHARQERTGAQSRGPGRSTAEPARQERPIDLCIGRLRHFHAGRRGSGTLGRFGLFAGRFIKGQFARLSHALLYRRCQPALHGAARAALLWAAERINALVQPKIRIT